MSEKKKKPLLDQFRPRFPVSDGYKPPPSLKPFETGQCIGCQFKRGSYCWNQCPYNLWRRKTTT